MKSRGCFTNLLLRPFCHIILSVGIPLLQLRALSGLTALALAGLTALALAGLPALPGLLPLPGRPRLSPAALAGRAR